MAFEGIDQTGDAKALFLFYFIVSAILIPIQIIYLQRLKLFPVYILPFLSFCISFVNFTLYLSNSISDHSALANAAYFFHSLIIPLFVIILHELTFRLHELRSAQFICIPFDQGKEVSSHSSTILLWSVRLLSCGLFIMNILSDYGFVSNSDSKKSGESGYQYMNSRHDNSAKLLLNLIPTMVLSLVSIIMGIIILRYGKNYTFESSSSQLWKFSLIIGIVYTITQIFRGKFYLWTSNLGNIALLINVSVLTKLIQDDLETARGFVDFLRQSNYIFHQVEKDNPRFSAIYQ